ncbi:26988_t:CDS:2 [Dentiscutata erythropus]|uniref:26988_t:CDS:1 n=1 Tax=Dentiscutata erythropus TaxID=1348616 RepID=A0A9N9NVQ7_9GLOM|nr:26988_t:CDS:2 [Dentiscutata erythropus]
MSKETKQKKDQELIIIEEFKKKSNYSIGYEFEKELANTLNDNGFIANIIACKQGDFGIDIIATYNQQTILIQAKNIEKPLGSPELQKIQSSFNCFETEVLEIIVYNSEKLTNSLTKNAKIW